MRHVKEVLCGRQNAATINSFRFSPEFGQESCLTVKRLLIMIDWDF
jgi:hypothetical protein